MKLLEEMKVLDLDFMWGSNFIHKDSALMLWKKNIMDYTKFGNRNRTNLYNLPFGLLMGLNNHFQFLVFGGVLLTTEKQLILNEC
jgi:hypothetical protein